MIKKLRRKFIIINMLFVVVVLLAVFIALIFSSSQALTNDIHRALTQAVNDKRDMPRLDNMMGGNSPVNDIQDKDPKFIAVYSFAIDKDGNQVAVLRPGNLIDDDNIDKIAKLSLDLENDKMGVIDGYDLYYYKRSLSNGYSIVALADARYYYESIISTLIFSLAIGAISLIAFFFISLFLSKWALKPVERAWTQQKQFIADASHELKTPLTVILANTKILLSKKNDKISEQIQWIESTEEESENMKQLVESLLFLARSDAESVEEKVMSERVNLSELVETSVLQFEPVSYEKDVELRSDIDENVMIDGDSAQLKRLVLILLDNANKYADSGGVISVALKGGRLSVYNSGEPIPSESLPHIFERFYRSDKARSDSSSFGLGLSIAQRIALNHGGSLSAVSSADIGGTEFTFTFQQQA